MPISYSGRFYPIGGSRKRRQQKKRARRTGKKPVHKKRPLRLKKDAKGYYVLAGSKKFYVGSKPAVPAAVRAKLELAAQIRARQVRGTIPTSLTPVRPNTWRSPVAFGGPSGSSGSSSSSSSSSTTTAVPATSAGYPPPAAAPAGVSARFSGNEKLPSKLSRAIRRIIRRSEEDRDAKENAERRLHDHMADIERRLKQFQEKQEKNDMEIEKEPTIEYDLKHGDAPSISSKPPPPPYKPQELADVDLRSPVVAAPASVPPPPPPPPPPPSLPAAVAAQALPAANQAPAVEFANPIIEEVVGNATRNMLAQQREDFQNMFSQFTGRIITLEEQRKRREAELFAALQQSKRQIANGRDEEAKNRLEDQRRQQLLLETSHAANQSALRQLTDMRARITDELRLLKDHTKESPQPISMPDRAAIQNFERQLRELQQAIAEIREKDRNRDLQEARISSNLATKHDIEDMKHALAQTMQEKQLVTTARDMLVDDVKHAAIHYGESNAAAARGEQLAHSTLPSADEDQKHQAILFAGAQNAALEPAVDAFVRRAIGIDRGSRDVSMLPSRVPPQMLPIPADTSMVRYQPPGSPAKLTVIPDDDEEDAGDSKEIVLHPQPDAPPPEDVSEETALILPTESLDQAVEFAQRRPFSGMPTVQNITYVPHTKNKAIAPPGLDIPYSKTSKRARYDNDVKELLPDPGDLAEIDRERFIQAFAGTIPSRRDRELAEQQLALIEQKQRELDGDTSIPSIEEPPLTTEDEQENAQRLRLAHQLRREAVQEIRNDAWFDGAGPKPKRRALARHRLNRALMDYELMEIMEVYRQFVGVCMRDELITLLRNGKTRMQDTPFGVICNLSPSTTTTGGTHWIAVYVDLEHRRQVCYYDPLARPIPKRIHNILRAFADEMSSLHMQKLKVNDVAHQKADSQRCGYFCAAFLERMFKSKGDFADSTMFDDALTEHEMMEREVSFRQFGYI